MKGSTALNFSVIHRIISPTIINLPPFTSLPLASFISLITLLQRTRSATLALFPFNLSLEIPWKWKTNTAVYQIYANSQAEHQSPINSLLTHNNHPNFLPPPTYSPPTSITTSVGFHHPQPNHMRSRMRW